MPFLKDHPQCVLGVNNFLCDLATFVPLEYPLRIEDRVTDLLFGDRELVKPQDPKFESSVPTKPDGPPGHTASIPRGNGGSTSRGAAEGKGGHPRSRAERSSMVRSISSVRRMRQPVPWVSVAVQ